MASKDLNVILGLQVENFQKGIRKAQRSMEKFARQMKSTGQSLTTNVTLPIVAIGGNALRTAAQFESAMNQVAAVSGATGKDFKDLESLAKDLGETTSFSASQAAEGMSFLAMAGLSVNDILESMPGVLNLAAAGQMDLAQASDIASNILTGFGKDASEMNQAVDVLAKTFTSSNTNLVQLGEAMAYVAPVAASAGLQFEEVSAAVGLLGNAGIQASMAGTTLRASISRLLSPTAEAQKILNELGISALDSEGNIRPLNEIVQMLEKSGASTAQIMEIFGERAGPGMAALVLQGSDALRSLTYELENSGGTAQKIADKQLEGLNGSLKRLQSAFEGLMISIAEGGLLDAATRLIEKLTAAVGRLSERFKNLSPEMQENILLIAGIAAAAGPLLMIFGNLVSVGSTLYGVFGKLKIGFMGGAAGLSRFIPIIGTAIALFTAMLKNSERLRNSFGPLFRAFGNVGKAIINLVDTVISVIPGFDGLNSVFKLLGDNLAIVLEGLTNIINGLLELDFKKLGAGFLDFIGVGGVRRALGDGKTFGEAYAEGIKEGVKNKFSNAEIDSLYAPFKQQFIPGITPLPQTTATGKSTAKPFIPSPTTVADPSSIAPKVEESFGSKAFAQAILYTTELNNRTAEYVGLLQTGTEGQLTFAESVRAITDRQQEALALRQQEIEEQNRLTTEQTKYNAVLQATTTITDSIFNALEQGKNVFKSLIQGIKQMVVQLIKAVAQAALFASILNILGLGTGSFLGSFKSILGIPGLASGGLVTGPTMALVGEGSGTSLSNPEVVAPLDKLRSMLSGTVNNNGFVASTKLQGSDLLLVVERAERNRNR